jgi:hypothetical protein
MKNEKNNLVIEEPIEEDLEREKEILKDLREGKFRRVKNEKKIKKQLLEAADNYLKNKEEENVSK